MTWLITPEFKNKGLLDAYPGAAAAYSLRNLSILQNPYIARVRRSSDNTESDFTATQVSDGTLVAFVGAGNNGFVRTWYDQSGNGNHATQTTTANQPSIVSSGSLQTLNTKPALSFNGSSHYLSAHNVAAAFTGTDKPASAFHVSKANNNTSFMSVAALGNSATNNSLFILGDYFNNNTLNFGKRDDASALSLTAQAGTPGASQNLVSATTDGAIINGYRQSTAIVSNFNCDVGLITLNRFTIGAHERVGVGSYLDGFIQEVIYYPSNLASSRLAIESNINAHYAIF
jgi:hypothetical protein